MTRKKVEKKEPEPIVETEEVKLEVKAEPEAPIKEEVTETPVPITETLSLDDSLLAYIKKQAGPFNIAKACVALNVEDTTLVHQAWDRLFDKGLVPYLNIK